MASAVSSGSASTNSAIQEEFIKAVADGDQQKVVQLFEKGVNLNYHTEKGTALHVAVQKVSNVMVELLLNLGADPLPEIKQLLRKGRAEIAFPLLDKLIPKTEQESFLLALYLGKSNLIAEYTSKITDLMNICGTSKNFFELVVQFNQIESLTKISIIIKKILNAPCADESNSYLTKAVDNDDLNIVENLLEHGADPNTPDGLDMTPLDFADCVRNHHIAETLLRYNADPNYENEEGRVLLNYAAKREDRKFVQVLIDYDADVSKALTIAEKSVELKKSINFLNSFFGRNSKRADV